MAKAAKRKKSAAKARTRRGAKPAKARSKKKLAARTKRAKKPARKARAASKPKGIRQKVSDAIHLIADTVKETEDLRDKLEPTGAEGA